MINLEQVKHIAQLSRIDFSEKELKKLQKELSLILDYIDKLNQVDIKEIEPTSHSVLIKNVFRKDKSKKNDSSLLNLVPEKKERFVKVKSVFKK